MTADDVFMTFTREVDKDTLVDEAGRTIFKMGSPLTIYRGEGGEGGWGAAGHVVRSRLLAKYGNQITGTPDEFKALVRRIVDHYGIPHDWIPPVPLVKEALALLVQAKRMLVQLPPPRHGDYWTIADRLANYLRDFNSPEEVFSLPYERLAEIADDVLDRPVCHQP